MELEKKGKHCQVCKQLDYLPFQCNDCKMYYCSEHIRTHNNCISNKDTIKNYIVCPLNKCKIHIDINNANDSVYINNKMDQHIVGNECHTKKSTLYKCKFCKVVSNVNIKCNQCGKQCCMKHRYPDTHKCIIVN